MALQNLWTRMRNFFSNAAGSGSSYPDVDADGLIDSDISEQPVQPAGNPPPKAALTKKIQSVTIEKKENIEVLNKLFGQLVGQLQGINEHLGRQVGQHEELMGRIDQLPDLLEALPTQVRDQKQVVDALADQLKARAVKDQQFAETIDKIPVETARQTNALVDMGHKLSAVADVDSQICENFNKFNDTLAKLDTDTVSQTDGIMQMNKTFAASDRYLKYIISRQNRRFMWVFMTALGVCLFAIIVLVIGIVIALNR
jgi:hypothetical protein